MNTRELVLDMLQEVTSQQIFSHKMVKEVLDKYDYLEGVEKRFIKRLFEGTLERMIELDYVMGQYAKVKGNKMKPAIRNILRMSIYQILYMDSVPDSAVCNEAVKLVKKKKYHQLGGFVNGVLRTIVRQKETIRYPNQVDEPLQYLSVRYSMPEWILEQWLAVYEYETVEQIAKALLVEHRVTVRLDEGLSSKRVEEIKGEWDEAGISYEQHTYLSYAYLLAGVEGIGSLSYFAKGYYTVQDISSMLVAEVAGLKADDKVLDVCAAPGGKSLHVATKLRALGGTGTVEARDVTEYKCAMLVENSERLQLTNLHTKVMDARVLDEQWVKCADVLLVDVPCSGLGVMGKKRDIKYNMTKEQIAHIVTLQKEIMETVKEYVAVGGTLLYSTCTISEGENEAMLQWILEDKRYVLESLDAYLPECLHSETTQQGWLQLLPGIHHSDGFFLARIKRVPSECGN